jgi:hypothetical protein
VAELTENETPAPLGLVTGMYCGGGGWFEISVGTVKVRKRGTCTVCITGGGLMVRVTGMTMAVLPSEFRTGTLPE